MGRSRPLRIAQPGDLLYRLVKPGHWDEQGLLPDAFQDQQEDLSLFLQRLKAPTDLMAIFARFSAARKACGTRNPTLAQMYAAGYRVASIPLREFLAAGYEVKRDLEGNQFDENGHLEIVHGQRNAAVWASRAHLLTREEILGISSLP